MFNKMDLASMKHKNIITDYYKNTVGVQKVLFSNCKEQVHYTIKKQVLPNVLDIIESNPRYNRENAKQYNLLIIGIPNVGKSSLINAMRRIHLKKGKATKVGPEAGVTKSLLTEIKVCETPPIYVLDTPGILQPRIDDEETGMKLALCGNLKDYLVGEMMIADYILFWMNKHEKYKYTSYFNLSEPTDDILELLSQCAMEREWFQKHKSVSKTGYELKPDFGRAAKTVINAFRKGDLGKFNLDDDLVCTIPLSGLKNVT